MQNRFDPGAALAAARAAEDGVYAVLLAHDGMELGYYAPVGSDLQAPHARDEIYIVRSGTGVFELDGNRRPFAPGDALFVGAGVPHRFCDFSPDFAAWVVFVGGRSEP